MALRSAMFLMLCVVFLGTNVDANFGIRQQLPKCTNEEAENQAVIFRQKCQISQAWTGCGSKEWLLKMYDLAPPGPRHLIDVGCNKGYESGLFFDLFAPQLRMPPSAMHAIHQYTNTHHDLVGDLCGACKNCRETMDRTQLQNTSIHTGVHVYCFEPSLRNFASLITLERHFRPRLAEHNSSWHLYNVAVSNSMGMTSFPRECGTTLCSLHNVPAGAHGRNKDVKYNMDMTMLVTMDAFALELNLERIDVLKIDTEGNDPSAVMGAAALLREHKVDLLYFEYNTMGMWETFSLKELIDWLAEFQYVCYFEGTPTLARLTGCWSELYNKRMWSNVVCTFLGSYMYNELERMTFLAQQEGWSANVAL